MLGLQPQQAPMQSLGPQITPDLIEKAKRLIDAPSWEDISAIFRSDERRNYKISVSTDALEEESDVEQMEQTLQFGRTIIEMMQSIVPGIQANPTLAPFSKELVMMVVKRFKVARPLEEALEDGLNQMANQPPAPPQPDPALIKAQAELQKAHTDAQIQQMKSSADLQKAQMDAQMQALAAREKQQQMQIDFTTKIGALQAQAHNSEQDRAVQVSKIQADNNLAATEMQLKHERELIDLEIKKEQVVLNRLEIMLKEKQLGISDRETSIKERDSNTTNQAALMQHQNEAQKLRFNEDTLRNEGAEKEAARREEIHKSLSDQLNKHHEALSAKQDQIAQAVEAIRQKSDATHQALGHVVDHMTSPRRVVRDEKGKPVGVEVVHKSGGEKPLEHRLAALRNGRTVSRDPKTGRAMGIE